MVRLYLPRIEGGLIWETLCHTVSVLLSHLASTAIFRRRTDDDNTAAATAAALLSPTPSKPPPTTMPPPLSTLLLAQPITHSRHHHSQVSQLPQPRKVETRPLSVYQLMVDANKLSMEGNTYVQYTLNEKISSAATATLEAAQPLRPLPSGRIKDLKALHE